MRTRHQQQDQMGRHTSSQPQALSQPQAAFRTRRRALVLGSLFTLAGCSALKPPKSTQVSAKITADLSINPAPNGIATPVVIRLYTLRSDTAFQQADFQSLFTADAATLGQDMLGKREFLMAPGKVEGYKDDVPLETAFLGVVVGFRNIDFADWRAIAPIQENALNAATVNITALSVAIPLVKVYYHNWF
ncbi:type VI secretion system lipoprotein TssJ [Xanthobacter sp. DSM 24535]|uniref:type VI secretion system lipoprotein TssJ n=1 Tax=Roseixanthobacter psychrophilus TaxID=3119917 RepID=UPI0037270069